MRCRKSHAGTSAILVCMTVVALFFDSPTELLAKEREKPLLRVHESIVSFSRKEDHVLEVKQNGRIDLQVKRGTIFSRGSLENKKSQAILNANELQILRDLLTGSSVQGLQDSYLDDVLTMDYSASMEIEIHVSERFKRIALPHLGFGGEHNSKIYPTTVHDLVCKIYGLEERAGFPYGHTVSVEADGRKSDDDWCRSVSLRLSPESSP